MDEQTIEIINEWFKKQSTYHNYDEIWKEQKKKVSGYIITNNQRLKLIKKLRSLQDDNKCSFIDCNNPASICFTCHGEECGNRFEGWKERYLEDTKNVSDEDIKLARQCMDFQRIKCDNKECLALACPLNKIYDTNQNKKGITIMSAEPVNDKMVGEMFQEQNKDESICPKCGKHKIRCYAEAMKYNPEDSCKCEEESKSVPKYCNHAGTEEGPCECNFQEQDVLCRYCNKPENEHFFYQHHTIGKAIDTGFKCPDKNGR